MKTPILAALALVLVATVGCSLVAPLATKAAGVIDRYCDEPQNTREIVRDQINNDLALEGHSIEVTCAGDDAE